jgi:hypothetical protein
VIAIPSWRRACTDPAAPLAVTLSPENPDEVLPNHHTRLGLDLSAPSYYRPGPSPDTVGPRDPKGAVFVPDGGDPYRSLRLGMYQPDKSAAVAVPAVPRGGQS